jgi:hypothetical protein
VLEPPVLLQRASAQTDLRSSSPSAGRAPSDTGNVDIRSLAQEVAAVLHQNPHMRNNMRAPPTMTAPNVNHDNVEQGYRGVSQSSHQPPPEYRAPTRPASSLPPGNEN